METILNQRSSVTKDKSGAFFQNTKTSDGLNMVKTRDVACVTRKDTENVETKLADIGNLINSFNQLRLKIKINESEKLKESIFNLSGSICQKISQLQLILGNRNTDIDLPENEIKQATLNTLIKNYYSGFAKFEACQETFVKEKIKHTHPKISEMQLEKIVFEIKKHKTDKRVSLPSFHCESQPRTKTKYNISNDLKREIFSLQEQRLQIEKICSNFLDFFPGQ